MWILTTISETLIHVILVVSMLGVAVGLLLGFIPFVNQYKLPIQIISIIGLVTAVYFEGGFAANQKHQLEIKELEVKIAKAEAKSSEKNIEIQEKIVEKIKIVRESGQDIVRYIDRVVATDPVIANYDEMCPVPLELVKIHNQATDLMNGRTK